MAILKQLAFAVCLLCGMHGAAYAQQKPGVSRGELLYATHCHACHTAEIHWRKQKLATDWNKLVAQVRRWQDNSGLGWSEEEITDVARYLNAAHYGFPKPAGEGYSQANKSVPVVRR